MGLLDELVSGIKAWVVMVLSDWIVVVVAAVVFVGTVLAGRVVFGAEVSLGLGIVAGLLAAYSVGPRLRNRLVEQ